MTQWKRVRVCKTIESEIEKNFPRSEDLRNLFPLKVIALFCFFFWGRGRYDTGEIFVLGQE